MGCESQSEATDRATELVLQTLILSLTSKVVSIHDTIYLWPLQGLQ
jgi:hypothetical protein